MSKETLITAKDLTVGYNIGKGFFDRTVLKAVNEVSIEIKRGSFFGLVGESGSGKTTLGRALLKAAPITGGQATFTDGQVSYDLATLSGDELKDYRKRAQLIFQDPYAALSPRMTVRDIIAEPLEVMGLTKTREETDARVREIAAKCRLNLEHLRRFPHAFSGGQRQRIAIARVMLKDAPILLLDEATSALDNETEQAVMKSIENLSKDLTLLIIAHRVTTLKNCTLIVELSEGGIKRSGRYQDIVEQSKGAPK